MRIYISGIGGVAMGPLAMIARDMGHDVIGSDSNDTDLVKYMQAEGFSVVVGQDGSAIAREHAAQPIDWFIHTAALTADHPELVFAREHGIRTSKRDDFINELLAQKQLKMLAISGTHGKTNTTGMAIWCLQQAGIPVSYSIGTRISFGKFGAYAEGSEYFIYEADEFDRNMLKFKPAISVLTTVDYDHPDTYSSRGDYERAFATFVQQSNQTYLYDGDASKLALAESASVHIFEKRADENITKLPGIRIRQNARLLIEALSDQLGIDKDSLVTFVDTFPGTERRMERLAEHVYTDYAHHPVEIASALAQASEIHQPVVAVYQPHQNIRQHEIANDYRDSFRQAQKVYWLPTYLSREADSPLPILSPGELIAKLDDPTTAEPAEMDDHLRTELETWRKQGALIVCLAAGDLDAWFRKAFSETKTQDN